MSSKSICSESECDRSTFDKTYKPTKEEMSSDTDSDEVFTQDNFLDNLAVNKFHLEPSYHDSDFQLTPDLPDVSTAENTEAVMVEEDPMKVMNVI